MSRCAGGAGSSQCRRADRGLWQQALDAACTALPNTKLSSGSQSLDTGRREVANVVGRCSIAELPGCLIA